jgi:hypothetical protein
VAFKLRQATYHYDSATGIQTPEARLYPLASFVRHILISSFGSLTTHALLGLPMGLALNNQQFWFLASLAWYVVSFSPFDIVYYLSKSWFGKVRILTKVSRNVT